MQSGIRSPYRIWFCIIVLCLLALATQAAGSDPYAAAVAAFKRGEYQRALVLFQRAREAGRDSVALRYNLAATYYRLGRYEQAAALFRSLLEAQPTLAAYNLGLIARARGDDRAAARRFRQALEAAEPGGRLAGLARRALDSLDAPAPPSPSVDGGAQLAAGYDDNVAFEPADSRAGGADEFLEAYLWGRYRYPLDGPDRLLFSVGLYGLGYETRSRYDLADLTARGAWAGRLGQRWRLRAGARLGRLWRDGRRALDTAGGELSLRRLLGQAFSLRLAYEGAAYRAPARYEYLQGNRHELITALVYQSGPWWWRGRYVRRWDQREDFSEGEIFASYSPRSHHLALAAQRDLTGGWSVDGELRYQRLDYAGTDAYAGVRRAREDTHRGADLRLQRRLGRHWRVYLEYRFGDNDSNIDSNDYQRNVGLVGVGWRAR